MVNCATSSKKYSKTFYAGSRYGAPGSQWYASAPRPVGQTGQTGQAPRGWYIDLNKSSGYRGPKP